MVGGTAVSINQLFTFRCKFHLRNEKDKNSWKWTFFCLCMATKVWKSYLIIFFAFTNFPTNMSTPHFYKSLKPIEHIIMTHLMGHFIIYWPHTACGHLNNEKQCIKYYLVLPHVQKQIQIQNKYKCKDWKAMPKVWPQRCEKLMTLHLKSFKYYLVLPQYDVNH